MQHNGRQLNALKHGAFAREVVLPGESREEFEQLYRSLLEELAGDGPLEEDTILSIAKIKWARQRLERWMRAKIDDMRVDTGMAPLECVAFFQPPFGRSPEQEDVDRAISACPEPYRTLIMQALKEKARSTTNLDEYINVAKETATSLLSQYRKELEAEPNSPDYQLRICEKIEEIQSDYITAAERLDAMIDRLFKRLFQLQTYKEIIRPRRDVPPAIEAVSNERERDSRAA